MDRVTYEFYEIDSSVPFYPTGCKTLDLVVGGGLGEGYPPGKVVCFGGEESSGKTGTIWETIIANFFHWGSLGIPFKWRFIDAERGSTHNIKEIYGLSDEDYSEFISCGEVVYFELVEEVKHDAKNFYDNLGDGEKSIYVVDSLDALKTAQDIKRDDEEGASMEKGKLLDKGTFAMSKQKYLSDSFFKNIIPRLAKKHGLFIYTKQARYNVSGMGAKYNFGGGKATDHYNDVFIIVNNTKKIERTVKGRSIVTGVGIKATVKKNKSPRPFGVTYYDVYFDYGIDDVGSSIDYLYNLRTETGVVKKSQTLDWDGKSVTREKLIQKIEEENLYEELNKRVIALYEEIADSVATKDKRGTKYGT